MPQTSVVLLVAGVLVFASVLASRLSDRVGIPALVFFLGLGMLAGSDGPGGIDFENAALANLVGTIALAYILFSGGLDTDWRLIRPVAARGIALSTIGVVVTAGLVAVFVWLVLGLPLLVGLLIGSIVSSTDAAAVFSVLRGRGVGLKGNLKPLLELESGSNDPMAVFLTVMSTKLLTLPSFGAIELVVDLLLNMTLGAAVGIAVGRFAGWLFNRIRLDYEGLYPVLSSSLVLLAFGGAEALKGNGFLAVYLCGLLLNGTTFAHKRATIKFHDGVAWQMQIVLFLVLGLLVFPSQLPPVAGSGLFIAAFLMFIARPLAVAVALIGSSLDWRQRVLVAWTGLRGAVPIVLATYPLLAGFSQSDLVFDLVFFVVLTSVLVQGTLLMPVARWLRVDAPLTARPKFSLQIERQGLTQGDTLELEILPNMVAVGKRLSDLGIPPEALVLLIGRGDGYVVPRGHTVVEPFDTLLLIGDPEILKLSSNILVAPPAASGQLAPAPMVDPLAHLPATCDEARLHDHVVLIGYGRVGRRVGETLARHQIAFVVVDIDRKIVERLCEQGIPALCGNGAVEAVLAESRVDRAAMLVLATPDVLRVRQMAELARELNPGIRIVARSHSEMEASLLEKEQIGQVFLGEHELADSIARHVLSRLDGDDEPGTPPSARSPQRNTPTEA
jgi:potassium/hydrogen antiporter